MLAATLAHTNRHHKTGLTTMKTNLTLILLTICFSAFGQTQKDKKLYYKTGELELISRFDSTCNCDKTTEYFKSGKIRSTKIYRHFGLMNLETQIDGEDILYFENGSIQIYYFWKDGTPSGRIYSNYPNGKLGYEKFYDNKFKTGTWKTYNEDGTLSKEIVFADNKTPWDSNDDYATEKLYFNNRLAYTVELIAGKKTNLTVIDKDSYDKLIASEPPLGQKLFRQNCAACHSANVDIVGPKLKGVTDIRTNDWLIKMITNTDALVKSGDKDAIALFKKWNNIAHPNFERLSNEEVTAIIDYMRTLK
jgi:antitoxin component YwqK of YwqJK toxin-antitoxin module/cytochrome c551/c552